MKSNVCGSCWEKDSGYFKYKSFKFPLCPQHKGNLKRSKGSCRQNVSLVLPIEKCCETLWKYLLGQRQENPLGRSHGLTGPLDNHMVKLLSTMRYPYLIWLPTVSMGRVLHWDCFSHAQSLHESVSLFKWMPPPSWRVDMEWRALCTLPASWAMHTSLCQETHPHHSLHLWKS
jgi:hypothetical protein